MQRHSTRSVTGSKPVLSGGQCHLATPTPVTNPRIGFVHPPTLLSRKRAQAGCGHHSRGCFNTLLELSRQSQPAIHRPCLYHVERHHPSGLLYDMTDTAPAPISPVGAAPTSASSRDRTHSGRQLSLITRFHVLRRMEESTDAAERMQHALLILLPIFYLTIFYLLFTSHDPCIQGVHVHHGARRLPVTPLQLNRCSSSKTCKLAAIQALTRSRSHS